MQAANATKLSFISYVSSCSTSYAPIAGKQRSCRQLHSSAVAKNHYDTLKLTKTATRQQIKAQFYRLSKEYHPDVKPGHEKLFQKISEAYATLGNADARRVYDASTTASSHYGQHPSGSYSSSYGSGYRDPDISGTRRARANYAWEHTRRTNPRYTAQNKHNPYSHQHTQHSSPEDDHYDRFQAREAWKASNMSSGARKRMEQEADNIRREEQIRNTSSLFRAIQAVTVIGGIMFLTGGFRASAWERRDAVDASLGEAASSPKKHDAAFQETS